MNVDDAIAKGFMREVAERSLLILEAMALPSDRLAVAMDLARYVRIPLDQATWALVQGRSTLSRLGLTVPAGADVFEYVKGECDGMAEAYTETFYGSMDVREAKGYTFTATFTGMIERLFGPR